MTFEFLIACRMTTETNISEVLRGLLSEALDNNQAEFAQDSVDQMIRLSHGRAGHGVADTADRDVVVGFSIELPDIESPKLCWRIFPVLYWALTPSTCSEVRRPLGTRRTCSTGC